MNRQLSSKVALLAALSSLAAAPALAFQPMAKGELFAQLDVRAEYDSNIYVNSAEVDDTLFTATPTLSFIRNAGLLRLDIAAGLEIQRFADNNQHDGENGRFSASLDWANQEGKSDAKLALGANRTAFANTYLNDRTVTDNFTLKGSFRHWNTEKLGFRLYTDLLEQQSVKGGYSDVRKQLVGIDGRYLMSPKLEGLFGYAYRHTGTYNDPAERTMIRSDDHRFTVGLEGDLTAKFSGELRVGYVLRQLDNGTDTENQNAPFAKAVLNWAAAEKTKFNLAVTKDFDTSSANQSINRFDVTLSATQELSAKFSATLMGNYAHGSYTGGSAARVDDSYMGRLQLNYQFTDMASAMVYVSTASSDSTLALSEYARQTVGFSIVAKF